jgi:hypothetical protein
MSTLRRIHHASSLVEPVFLPRRPCTCVSEHVSPTCGKISLCKPCDASPARCKEVWEAWKVLVQQVGGDKTGFLHAWLFSCLEGEQRYGRDVDKRDKMPKLHLRYAPVLRGLSIPVDYFVNAVESLYKSGEVKTVREIKRSSALWLKYRLVVCKDMDYESHADIIGKALTYTRISRKVVEQLDTEKVAGKKPRGRPSKGEKVTSYFDGVRFNGHKSTTIEKEPFRVTLPNGKKVDVLPRSQFLIVSQLNFDQFPFVVVDGEKEMHVTDEHLRVLRDSHDAIPGILSKMYREVWYLSPEANDREVWRPKQGQKPADLPTRWLRHYVNPMRHLENHKVTVEDLRLSFGDFVTNANGNVMQDAPFVNALKFGRFMRRIIAEYGYPLTKCRIVRRNKDFVGYKFSPHALHAFLNPPTSV